MTGHAYELVEEGRLRELRLEDALKRWHGAQGTFWLDAGALDRSRLEPLLDQLGVSVFLKERCFRVGHSTLVLALPQATFATLPLFADEARTRRAYGAALCLPNLLLTFHSPAIENAERIHQHIERLELDQAVTSNLLCAFLLRRATTTAHVARELRDETSRLTEQMDHIPKEVDSLVVERLKRRVALTNAIAEEQREAFDLIARAKSSGFDVDAVATPLGLVTTMAAATERLIDRTDDRVSNLLRRLQDQKTELLNRRLGLLTIISAIFMPLSLLAGIWGMNFENMPELSHPYAYGAALSFMALIALGSAILFYRRGWFD